jgi:hypothetical protein
MPQQVYFPLVRKYFRLAALCAVGLMLMQFLVFVIDPRHTGNAFAASPSQLSKKLLEKTGQFRKA